MLAQVKMLVLLLVPVMALVTVLVELMAMPMSVLLPMSASSDPGIGHAPEAAIAIRITIYKLE
jgi:hypothetical protein